MAEIPRLVETRELKMTQLKEVMEDGNPVIFFRYDDAIDALMMLFIEPTTETVVHYLDDFVGLLYRPETKEVVGIQVENFERKFIHAHATIENVWRLSDCETEMKDFGDIVLCFERIKPVVVKEVTRITKSLLHDQVGNEFVLA